ncbi:MAG: hypothetical protein H7Y09_11230 [Chitinophagaceae bacterium]|nr:hypothetical protein [Anaerolineae bacterium]
MNKRYWIRAALMSAVLLITMMGFTIFAQEAPPPLAAVTNGGLFLYEGGAGSQVESTNIAYYDLTWSPDGSKLAYTVNDGNATRLMLTDSAGSAPTQLAGNVSYIPVTFTEDSAQVIYTIEDSTQVTTMANGLPGSTMNVFLQGVEGQVATFGFGVGCGGGSPFPMDAVYNTEAGFGGSALTFENTAYGILYSTACTGQGLALLNLETGENVSLGDNLSRAKLAPDGRRALMLQGGGLSVLDLESRQVSGISTSAAPDQIGWGADGSAYYSTRTLRTDAMPMAPEEASAFSAYLGMDASAFPQYEVALYQVDVNTGAEAQVYAGPGWAVGRIFAAQGGLYFSLVPNGEAWVEAIAAGTLDITAPDSFFRERQIVAARLMRLVGDGTAVEVGTDIGQATPKP